MVDLGRPLQGVVDRDVFVDLDTRLVESDLETVSYGMRLPRSAIT